MSVWTDDTQAGALDWLQHGICDQSLSNPCGAPDLKFRNFKFTTKDGAGGSNSGSTGDSGNTGGSGSTGDSGNTGGSGTGGSTTVTDIAAGFAAIRTNPNYSSTQLSRTLFQVDQSFDFIEQQLISMQTIIS